MDDKTNDGGWTTDCFGSFETNGERWDDKCRTPSSQSRSRARHRALGSQYRLDRQFWQRESCTGYLWGCMTVLSPFWLDCHLVMRCVLVISLGMTRPSHELLTIPEQVSALI